MKVFTLYMIPPELEQVSTCCPSESKVKRRPRGTWTWKKKEKINYGYLFAFPTGTSWGWEFEMEVLPNVFLKASCFCLCFKLFFKALKWMTNNNLHKLQSLHESHDSRQSALNSWAFFWICSRILLPVYIRCTRRGRRAQWHLEVKPAPTA